MIKRVILVYEKDSEESIENLEFLKDLPTLKDGYKLVKIDFSDIKLETNTLSKNIAAITLGTLGGKKGGDARAIALTPERRSEIAKTASRKRWGTKKTKKEKMIISFAKNLMALNYKLTEQEAMDEATKMFAEMNIAGDKKEEA